MELRLFCILLELILCFFRNSYIFECVINIMGMVKGLCDPVIENLKKAMRFWASDNKRDALKSIKACQIRLRYIKSAIKKYEKP